ncbi:MAG: DUF134 domain-containing protein [Candidatus Bathyarchaeia archaeon]
MEALKLVELEKLTFEEASARIRLSGNTVWRLAEKGARKPAKAIVEVKKF